MRRLVGLVLFAVLGLAACDSGPAANNPYDAYCETDGTAAALCPDRTQMAWCTIGMIPNCVGGRPFCADGYVILCDDDGSDGYCATHACTPEGNDDAGL